MYSYFKMIGMPTNVTEINTDVEAISSWAERKDYSVKSKTTNFKYSYVHVTVDNKYNRVKGTQTWKSSHCHFLLQYTILVINIDCGLRIDSLVESKGGDCTPLSWTINNPWVFQRMNGGETGWLGLTTVCMTSLCSCIFLSPHHCKRKQTPITKYHLHHS